MTSTPLTPAHMAFYATAATVIPVLFIAIAVQGSLAEAPPQPTSEPSLARLHRGGSASSASGFG